MVDGQGRVCSQGVTESYVSRRHAMPVDRSQGVLVGGCSDCHITLGLSVGSRVKFFSANLTHLGLRCCHTLGIYCGV